MSGRSATSIRRCTPGRPGGCSRSTASSAAATGDLAFLERVFHKLLLNFTWWVNRKDAEGRNIFQGGFLGLDNIGVFDRSQRRCRPAATSTRPTAPPGWRCIRLNLMRIALELAPHNHVYEDIATKFFEHFLYIAERHDQYRRRRHRRCGTSEDEFYYDVLNLPDGSDRAAARALDGRADPAVRRRDAGARHAGAAARVRPRARMVPRATGPDLAALVSRWTRARRSGERRLLSLLRGHRMKQLLRRMLDETEFLSDYGVRSLSKVHEQPALTSSTVDGAALERPLPARRIRQSACSAATPTGAGRSGCRSTTC